MKYFKLMALCGVLLVSFTQAQAQANAIDKYFSQYVDDERFTVVYVSSKMFQLFDRLDVGGLDMDEEESKIVKNIAKDLRGLRILSADEDGLALYKEAKSKISTQEYEVLMTVRTNDGENVDFLIKDNDNIIEELLLLVGGEDDEFALLSFVGRLDLNSIVKLANSMEEDKKKE
ncbi:MAG: DUF4252 domain-containing protein [Bacteroidota bacterium]